MLTSEMWPIVVARSKGLRPLACWDCGFEFHRERGCLSLMNVVCCQVEVAAKGRSVVCVCHRV